MDLVTDAGGHPRYSFLVVSDTESAQLLKRLGGIPRWQWESAVQQPGFPLQSCPSQHAVGILLQEFQRQVDEYVGDFTAPHPQEGHPLWGLQFSPCQGSEESYMSLNVRRLQVLDGSYGDSLMLIMRSKVPAHPTR